MCLTAFAKREFKQPVRCVATGPNPSRSGIWAVATLGPDSTQEEGCMLEVAAAAVPYGEPGFYVVGNTACRATKDTATSAYASLRLCGGAFAATIHVPNLEEMGLTNVRYSLEITPYDNRVVGSSVSPKINPRNREIMD